MDVLPKVCGPKERDVNKKKKRKRRADIPWNTKNLCS